MKTQEEIQQLKDGWLKDPCWDIEKTIGFEEHETELLEFRNKMEAQWQSEIEEKLEARRRTMQMMTGINDRDLAQCLFTPGEIEHELSSLDSQIGDAGSAVAWAQFVIAREQVRATLLLSAQVKRVADALEEANLNTAGTDNLDFNTRLYKVD